VKKKMYIHGQNRKVLSAVEMLNSQKNVCIDTKEQSVYASIVATLYCLYAREKEIIKTAATVCGVCESERERESSLFRT
jgi:hypothetical protein